MNEEPSAHRSGWYNGFLASGWPSGCTVMLLHHGFPTSSFQYRELMPRLADRCRVITPNLLDSVLRRFPKNRHYKYTFDTLTNTTLALMDAMQLKRYAVYSFRLRRSHRLSF